MMMMVMILMIMVMVLMVMMIMMGKMVVLNSNKSQMITNDYFAS